MRIAHRALLLVAVGILAPATARAQAPSPSLDVEVIGPVEGQRGYVNWSVKFLCGTIGVQDAGPLAPGVYHTAINLQNGQFWRESGVQRIWFYAMITNPISAPRGPITPITFVDLTPKEGFEWECDDIRRLFGANVPSGFIKGYVQLASSTANPGLSRLVNVVGVYTVRPVE